MGMPIEDLQGDWNAVSFSIAELGRCTAVLELHLLDRNREKHRFDMHATEIRGIRVSILGGGENKEVQLEYHKSLLHTCTPMSLLHPDITIRLGYASLRVQKRHENASFSTQACIVTMTLFHRISVILLSQPECNESGKRNVLTLVLL